MTLIKQIINKVNELNLPIVLSMNKARALMIKGLNLFFHIIVFLHYILKWLILHDYFSIIFYYDLQCNTRLDERVNYLFC